MRKSAGKQAIKKISAKEFDHRFEKGDDLEDFLDFAKAVVVRRVNIDFPDWMVRRLDREAEKLNISRQAVVKMWIHDRLMPHHS